jgi:hypothetical protein
MLLSTLAALLLAQPSKQVAGLQVRRSLVRQSTQVAGSVVRLSMELLW